MSTFLNLNDLNLHVRIDYEYAAKIPTINFENRLTFVQFISNIRDTISGEITDSITVTEDAKTIDLVKNGFLCIDLFDGLNLNERRFVNAVITELSVMINNDPTLQQEFTEVSAQIENYFEKICTMSTVALDYDSLTLNSLFKMMNIKIFNNEFDFKERLYCYIDLISKVFLKPIVFFVNLPCFLSEFELVKLYEMSKKKNVYIISLVSSGKSEDSEIQKIKDVEKDVENELNGDEVYCIL